MDYLILIKFLLSAFIKGVFTSTYEVSFEKESDHLWYVIFPGWPKKYHSNLQMVAGAEKLLSYLLKSKYNIVTLQIKTRGTCPSDFTPLVQEQHSLFGGSWYKISYKDFKRSIWICPVTLFVLGRYPKNIYIKQIK